jgi:hypothetical protein
MTDTPTPPTGTIDITNVVEKMRETFVTWATAYIYGEEIAIPGLEWVALPILSTIDKDVITAILNVLTNSVLMEAFFLNTAIRKASQAQNYVDAINAKNSLPPTASDAEYEKAEQAEMLTFRNFVMLSN